MSITTNHIYGLAELINKHNPEQSWIKDNLIMLCRAGSHLYNTNTETSDEDIRGICIAPKSYWVGAKTFNQFECKYPEKNSEYVIYDFRKWLNLGAFCVNPNLIELLYVEKDNPNVIYWTNEWEELRPQAKQLVNQRAYVGFHGYSTSQLKKMVIKQSNKSGRQYITEEYGFDLKFASHGFRLVRQGIEILTTNNITFPRPDSEWLKAVRNGEIYGPDDMQKCIEDWEAESEKLQDALDRTILPAKANFDLYNSILINVFDLQVNREVNYGFESNHKLCERKNEMAE